jgi:predicted nucleic acid-binding protein
LRCQRREPDRGADRSLGRRVEARRPPDAIAALGITVHQPNEAIGVEAARLRQRHPISLPDAYCLATAKHTSSAVSSFDRKILKAATREGIKAA